MTASLLDGKAVSSSLRSDLNRQILERTRLGYSTPTLAVIRVGDDPSSVIYVNNKIKACHDVGFKSISHELPGSTSHLDLMSLITTLNQDSRIHGILVQLPLPEQMDTQAIIEHIAPHKDVDGFHPYNLGRLAQGNPFLRPCTPFGIMQLLQHYHLTVKGLHAVVVGASNIVGRPMALELLFAQATVTICHRATRSLEMHIRSADLVVSATGQVGVIKTEWLQPHQIIIDVGIHRREDGRLHGDIDFAEARKKVAWITPVPGGVGPMTIGALLQNTLTCQAMAW